MNIVTHIGLAIGLLLLISLLIWQGVLDVANLLLSSGWSLLWLPLIWLPSFIPATQGWRVLFDPQRSPGFTHSLLAMWMGRAVNNLLPVATIGGEIAKARLIHFWGIKGTDAAASVMVDKVVQAISVALWGLIGVCSLLYLSDNNELAFYAFLGSFILALCSIGFLYVQKAGLLGILTKLGGKLIKTDAWEGISFNAREIDAAIVDIYANKAMMFWAIFYRTLGLALQTAEVYLACYLLGHPISILEAIMLKSLSSTLSDAVFVIPNAYGIQEGAFILVGSLVGLDANTSLAVSLSIRIRDLIFDPAGLMTLHQIESKQFVKRKLLEPAAKNGSE
ncbi:MAG: putative membrane protein [Gammaproteobacteria bacterium]|jgi:putative membrane protein